MREPKVLDQIASQTSTKPEIRLKARAVSRGVAIGRIVCLYGSSKQFYRYSVPPAEVTSELVRFQSALAKAELQLSELEKSGGASGPAVAGVVEAQRLMAEDEIYRREIEAEITEKLVNAEWAVKTVTDNYASRYMALPDEHLRERAIDIEDVGERILSSLGGATSASRAVEPTTIIASEELRPSTLAEMSSRPPAALMTEHGGWTSHTFILARELNIPAVTGLKKLLRRARTGDEVIVDGYNGLVILNPSRETLAKYRIPAAQFAELDHDGVEALDRESKTLDGREIIVKANLDVPQVYGTAKRFGARGVGLYRSEYLFSEFKGFPTEAEQYEAYRELTEIAGADGVSIRTFDLGVDRISSHVHTREKNPALGLRAIRLGLTFKDELRAQLRALLRASAGRVLNIVIPMVSGLPDIRAVKLLIEDEKARLDAVGLEFGTPKIGAMVEVPSAVLTVDDLLEETDFISLGTNDLIQYLLAVDRDNESVADWFNSLHPAVLRVIRDLVVACERHQKPLVVCGEMAGSAFYVPLLVGLGVRELSMNVNSILRARKIIGGIAFDEAREMAHRILKLKTAQECDEILLQELNRRWAHLYPAGSA